MAFVLVPPNQKRVPVRLVGYNDESDKGPYPVPEDMPIEGWPAWYRGDPKLRELSLDDVQRDKIGQGGDRHAIVVDPTNRMLYEFYTTKTNAGWEAMQASIFDLKVNTRSAPKGGHLDRRGRPAVVPGDRPPRRVDEGFDYATLAAGHREAFPAGLCASRDALRQQQH